MKIDKSIYKMRLLFNLLIISIALVFSPDVISQCGFQATCPNTNYLNFGMGSNSDAATIEYDNFISCFHSTAARTANGTYEVWGEDIANNGTGNLLSPTVVNATNFPALTGDVLKVHLGSNIVDEQGIVLTTTGLFAWSTEGVILHPNATTSSTFQKLTINGQTDGLPIGVDPLDVKMIFTTHLNLVIVTCSGSVYVLTQQGENAGRNLTGTLTSAASLQWYQVQEVTAGNPAISNVIAVRGNRNTLFALKSDGTLWTWGLETYLGNGTASATRTRATQMTLPSANPIKMIGVTRNDNDDEASYYVVNANGNMYSLGNNSERQLGDWTTTERRSWVQPRYTSAAGPVMNNVHWISPNEHDPTYPAVNVLNSDSTNYNWGESGGEMLGRTGTGSFNPGIPNGISITDKILAVETGGHTSMLAKKCEDYFGYVGHRINGSMGNGSAAGVFETTYSFATAVVFICGASTASVAVSGTPTLSPGGLYCNGTSTDLLPSPAGGTLSILSGPATLAGTVITFTGTGNTTVNVQYAITVPGCPIAKTATTTLLTEDCVLPTVSLSGTTTIAENAAGVATLTATLSAVSATPTIITITYSGTAVGADYVASSVTITIPAGSLTGTVTIDPTDDAIFEGSETVIADITSVSSASGVTENGTQQATVTITDNETIPTVTLTGTTTIAENAAGVATLTATLSNAATTDVTVTIAYTGTAVGADYTASSVTITIPAGSTTGTVTIDPTDDALVEGSETVIADITNVTGGNGATESGTQTATVTITDNDAPTVTLTGTTSIAENAAGVATLTATLSAAAPTATDITITYTGTAVGADYTASSVTITIPAGSTTGTVTVDPTDDLISEGSETVIADITAVTGGNGATESGTQTATVTITDNDAPTVTLTGTTSIAEDAAGVATLTATLSNVATTDVTVTIAFTGTAVGADYTASSVTITIPAGSTTGTVTVDPTDDALVEGSETVIADITNVTGGNGATESGTQTATVTITDNDAPTVTLTGTTSIAENAAGVATLTATLSAAAPTATDITITYTGTAVGADYTASSVTITIPAGSTTGTVTVDPTDDLISEGSETVIADITAVTGGNGATESGTQTATVTITDNDAPTVTLTGTTSIAEDAAGVATLTATLSNVATTDVTVTIAYTGTAVGADYTASSVTITIPAGSTTGTVTVDPTDDLISEGSETVIADIIAVTGGNGATESGTQTATVTITDNDAPTVTLTGTTSIAEDAAGVATLTATLSNVATTDVTVTIAYTGTVIGADYTVSSVTITIPAGSTTGTVTVDPTDDLISEGSETVIADIIAVTGGNGATESGTQTATVTITDNDAPTVTLTGTTSIAEDAAGVATLTATLSNVATTDVTVTIAYTGTAIGADYTASSVTITIPVGSTTGTVTVDPTVDAVYEGSETVIADITNVTGGNGATESGSQQAIVTIIDINTPPVAVGNSTTTNEDQAVTLSSVQSNDSDADGTVVVGTIDLDPTQPGQQTTFTNAQGTWVVNTTTGDVTFTPSSNFNGTATIQYTITDNAGATSNSANLTVTVNPINDGPVVDNETHTINEEGTATGDLTNAGDSDLDGNLVVTTTPVDGPNNGTIVINPDGTYTYTPSTNFNGLDTIVVQICDDGTPLPVLCVYDTIFITVNPINDGPIIDNENVNIPYNGVGTGDLTDAGDSDVDGNLVVSTTTVDAPNNGTIIINSDGTFTYTPNTNFVGQDTIVVQICDDGSPTPIICVNDTIFITVNPCSATDLLADCDQDGVTNGDEIDPDGDGNPGPNGTDPFDPCSLNVADQTFASASASWLAADCDGDGETNGEEVDPDGDGTAGPNGTNPTDPCSYDPALQDLAIVTVAWLALDCDNDGLSNEEEVDPDGDGTPGPNGTNPLNPDSDGDGVTDGDEESDGTNGNDPCDLVLSSQTVTPSAEWLALDCDNDSLTNENEVIIGTDPFNPDSDGDGVTDGDEVDPDGDGTPGPNGTNPNDPCNFTVADQTVAPSSEWLAADCDDDGVTNGDEVAGGSDPLNPCSPNLCEISIPQAFSPDGDGINDNFVIEGIELIPDNEITILNRWGTVVFQTSNYQNNWDGTSSNSMNVGGGDLPTGTYYYILDPNKEGYEVYKGYIYLQR